jgi:clan AA aspartic protease (TIGR02281 family)
MEQDGGVYKVPCEVNGLRMKLVFDTGAAVVSLSQTMAEFMVDNDYMSTDDIYGVATMKQADGTTIKVPRVLLGKINIGGLLLYDVDAVISPSQNAPLLLGQSAIQKLGRITIRGNSLIISKEEANYTGSEREIAFQGLRQGTSYNECYDFLSMKYGNRTIYDTETNGAIRGLDVDSVYFVNHFFDTISLYFEKDKLATVKLVREFPRNKLSDAIRFKDELITIYAGKYTAIKTSKQPNTNNAWSYLGFEEKDNYRLSPIRIGLTESESTTQSYGDKPIIKKSYKVILMYWPIALDRLKELFPMRDEF